MEKISRTIQIESWLAPEVGWEVQPDEYYAAHFLIGAGLITGDTESDEGKIRALAAELRKMYEIGVEHGCRTERRGAIEYVLAS